MAELILRMESFELSGDGRLLAADYSLDEIRRAPWQWDKVVKGSHLTNCAYQQACNFKLYVKDGVILREEQRRITPRATIPRFPTSIRGAARKAPAGVPSITGPIASRSPSSASVSAAICFSFGSMPRKSRFT